MIHRPLIRFFTPLRLVFFLAAAALAACSGEMPVEKAILGTWVQDTPVSMSDNTMRTTTSDTVLTLGKNGNAQLSRILVLQSADLPEGGLAVNVDLRGRWALNDRQLIITPEETTITARSTAPEELKLAEDLQAQTTDTGPSIKSIIAADKTQLILQDTQTGATDVYRRK